jgi:hypothetical protein
MQIDLQNPLEIYKVIQDGVELNIIEKGMSLLSCASKPGAVKELTVFYGGKPKVAVNPPWDGELLGKTAMGTIYSVFLQG